MTLTPSCNLATPGWVLCRLFDMCASRDKEIEFRKKSKNNFAKPKYVFNVISYALTLGKLNSISWSIK